MKERIQLLIDALRSGEFKRGVGTLRQGNHYCCLGVACELYRRHTGKGEWESSGGLGHIYFFTQADEFKYSAVLPQVVVEWFGFGEHVDYGDPKVKNPSGYIYSASAMNDMAGSTFEKVADAFERMYITNADTK